MDLDSKRMLDKEEEEEEGQTSRGSPVIGKCFHWQPYSEHDFWGVIYFNTLSVEGNFLCRFSLQGHLSVTVIVASVMGVLDHR